MIVEVPALDFEALSTRPAGERSADIRGRVNAARARQTARQGCPSAGWTAGAPALERLG